LYGGWLTAASFVSIGLLLAGYGIVGEVVAAVIALVLALCFALYFQRRLGIWTYGVAVSWGFSGITAANVESQLVIAVLAGIATIIVLATTVTNAKSKLQG
jgi:hypothetical protein